MWYLKHRPRDLSGFLGKTAVEEARKWSGGPLMISGPAGTGKTLLARLLAAERGWEVVEVSDENMTEAETIANTTSLFGAGRMLLIEDVEDIKEIKAVGELLEMTRTPVVLTATDYGSRRLATIKKRCAAIHLRRPLPASIAKCLQGISQSEGVTVEKSALDAIAKNSGGDIRAAVTDLEMFAKGRGKVGAEEVAQLMPERDRESDIYKALSVIFGGREFKKVVESTWDLSEQPKDIIWWVEENAPRLYQDKAAISEAYANLSRADVFLGRIMRRQYWGFLRYANVMMTAGVNVARPEKVNYTQYMFPGFFAAMGRTKGVRATESSIAAKMRPHLHVSGKIVRREYIPLYRLLIKRKKVTGEELKALYFLDDEELEYLSS